LESVVPVAYNGPAGGSAGPTGAPIPDRPAAIELRRSPVSRIPRHLEHLKTGFTAEAVSAARFRAYAERAERDGLPQLARQLRRLAETKDELAIAQLEAAGQVRGAAKDLAAAIAEESYENDVLYPKMIHGVGDHEAAAEALRQTLERQRRHLERLEALRDAYNAASGDVAPPQGG
jgi:rubrerythrin